MRIAILSDIHGNLPALEAVVRDMDRRGVDTVVNLGDSLSGPLMPRETAAFLMEQTWLHLAGNHERQLLTLCPESGGPSDVFAHAQLDNTMMRWVASLKPLERLTDLVLCHGTPSSDKDYLLETVDQTGLRLARLPEIRERLGHITQTVLCGHTHLPRHIRLSPTQLVINPGSVGLPAYQDSEPYSHGVETGSPDARYAILDQEKKSVDLIAVQYAHQQMVNLAKARHRLDWAIALSSGYAI